LVVLFSFLRPTMYWRGHGSKAEGEKGKKKKNAPPHLLFFRAVPRYKTVPNRQRERRDELGSKPSKLLPHFNMPKSNWTIIAKKIRKKKKEKEKGENLISRHKTLFRNRP